MDILLVGQSKKFIEIVNKIWPESTMTIVSWRSIEEEKLDKEFQLIIICGYDYSSYKTSYENYFNKNVIIPFKFIKNNYGKNTNIIYIMTEFPKKKWTFSRYLYAKYSLANLLINANIFSYTIPIPTIINDSGNVEAYSPSSGALLYFLKKFKLIKCIKLHELEPLIKYYKRNQLTQLASCKPIGLKFKRNIFLDRTLRVLLG